eukprot:6025328-Prymnesium_polylepis.1
MRTASRSATRLRFRSPVTPAAAATVRALYLSILPARPPSPIPFEMIRVDGQRAKPCVSSA